jgi:hypothetical protein
MANSAAVPRPGMVTAFWSRHHTAALNVFLLIVLAHWAEHVMQAVQIWGMGWKAPEAKGVLGLVFPWLVTSEWLHYGYALIMLAALIVLRHGFTGPARSWWNLAVGIQAWHHIEHLLLLVQAITGSIFFGGVVPTSVLQVFFPRVELHLFYNAIVTFTMIVAVVLHGRRTRSQPPDAFIRSAQAPA